MSEFNIEFKPRKTIQAQALADFVAECAFFTLETLDLAPPQQNITSESLDLAPPQQNVTSETPTLMTPLSPTTQDIWLLYTDGSSAQKKVGGGIYLKGPKNEEFEYCVRLNFSVTNNVAEYEALIIGLKLARKIRARKVVVHVDSQLISKQVSGEYEAKDPLLFSYRQEVQSLIYWFNTIEIKKIPMDQNESRRPL